MVGRRAPTAPWLRQAAGLLGELAAFSLLLFITRFLARPHLVPRLDQECHIGGIAVDVLARGVRFPLMAYAPNEYDNGSFFSGLLASVSFAVLGRSLLALKLVTHVVSAAGAVATSWLLRGCLDELGLTRRRERWTAMTILIVAIALAPRIVTVASLYAVGTHAEGAAIDAILLALFARRFAARSDALTAAFWALVGFALYLNKGTVLVIPLLGAAEIVLARRPSEAALVPARRLAAALAGFALGVLPELLILARRHGLGWLRMADKAARNPGRFPSIFFDSIATLVDGRPEILVALAVALVVGVVLALRVRTLTLSLVAGCSLLFFLALAVMAQGHFDRYVLYGYPTLVVLLALLGALATRRAAARWGERGGWLAAGAAIALSVLIHRPDALHWGGGKVSAMWRDREGGVCAWRFAEGFGREYRHDPAPPGQTREEHVIERCRSLTEEAQALDCIGGIGRELHWRDGGKVEGAPPLALTQKERLAYAFDYGVHRAGDVLPCGDFESPELKASCESAVRLDCLVFGDVYAGMVFGESIGPPRCDVPAPPMDGFWAAARRDLVGRTTGMNLSLAPNEGLDGLQGCKAVLASCY